MKLDTPGFLDVKIVVIAKDGAAWLPHLTSLGEVEHEETLSGWQHRRVRTQAKLRDLAIRVLGYVGPPPADVTVGFIGAARLVSDGTTEIPDVSIADVPRVVGPPSKETLLGALKDVLRGAAKG
jgi:hypothetical protein